MPTLLDLSVQGDVGTLADAHAVVIEGTLALTGQEFIARFLEGHELLPGCWATPATRSTSTPSRRSAAACGGSA